MTNELYEGLIEIYKDFINEKEYLINKENNSSNDYQKSRNLLGILETRIDTLSSILKIFENYFSAKKNEFLEENKRELEIKENHRGDIFNKRLQILDIQEKERHRIARDLHDTTLQNLSHLVHNIELSSLYIDKDPIRARLELEVVNKKLKSVIQEMRNIIFDLRPMTFDDFGIKESLKD